MLEKIIKSIKHSVMAGSIAALSLVGCEKDRCDVYNGGGPSIEFTHVPKVGSYDYVEGEVKNVDPTKHKVAMYIKVGNTWWMKPYWSTPLSNINECGEFSIDYTTGGIDQQANTINAYLVTSDFKPTYALPDMADPKVLAMTTAGR